ncbi:MAG: YceI family protein [Solirubrobacteraceae bacterium]
MAIESGAHELGPESARLVLRTSRTGAAAKAGHDLVIEVTSWKATIEVGESLSQTSIQLTADATSLRVRQGTGGMQALSDNDRASIQKTIDDDVLKRKGIEFRSTRVNVAPDRAQISGQGELELVGRVNPIDFEVAIGGDGKLRASATVTQSSWGIKPYSALFGALKVADVVAVELEATLPQS